jgi:hypothetical protein
LLSGEMNCSWGSEMFDKRISWFQTRKREYKMKTNELSVKCL